MAEGVIQFAYDLRPPDGAPGPEDMLAQLNAWRTVLKRLQLLGQIPGRYDGLGFGNLSARDWDRPGEFVISASQSGHRPKLAHRHWVRILHCGLERFWIDAMGQEPPSSEAMTHAMIYAADPRVKWVFHGHAPEIWQRADALGLPTTAADFGYGSSDMVHAVANLLDTHQSRPLVFATLGHQDGVFACGPTARDTGGLLVSYLARALA